MRIPRLPAVHRRIFTRRHPLADPWGAWWRLTAVMLAIAMLAAIAMALTAEAAAYDPPLHETHRRGELTPEHAAHLYAMAYGQAGLPLPERAPTIRLVPQATLREIIACPDCPVRGLQIQDTVYVDEALDFANPYHASVLLHEMVHYLQWSARGEASTCEEFAERERHALAVQGHVLAMAGLDRLALLAAARNIVCR